METVVILGAGQMGRAARNLLNMNNMELVAIGDNNRRSGIMALKPDSADCRGADGGSRLRARRRVG